MSVFDFENSALTVRVEDLEKWVRSNYWKITDKEDFYFRLKNAIKSKEIPTFTPTDSQPVTK
jgi:hypothetical protein